MSSLKQKTISGILWSSIDSFANQGITFIVGIILARLLAPKEFGLIGMTTIFIAISESFIRSGFSDALIRKKDCTQGDYSTVFFYNFSAGLLFFSILFLSAPTIGKFFKEPDLNYIIRVLALVLIIDSLTIIQNAILIKRVDFKLLTRISIFTSIGSGVFAIILAYKGFGVWSLVALTLTKQTLRSLLLWLWIRWHPNLIFSRSSFIELFGFGSKLLLSGLIDTIYRNIYNLVIGKYFSSTELGYYTRADTFSNLPAQNINMVTSRVTYPILAQMQDDPILLKEGYRRIIKSTMLVTFVLMLGLSAVAEPMIITLIGEKWRTSIVYLQLLCFGNMLYPLHAINLNMLKVRGRSDLFLKLELIKKALAIPVIIIGVLFGIRIMIFCMIFNSFVAYYINSSWSGKLIDYSIKQQVKDIMPSFLMAAGISALVFLLGFFLKTSHLVTLILQVIAGALLVFCFCELTKMTDYLYIKQIIVDKVFRRK